MRIKAWLSLSLVLLISLVANAQSNQQIIDLNQDIPPTPSDSLWEIVRIIDNSTTIINPVKGTTSGNRYQLKMVKFADVDPQAIIPRVEVGGHLKGSSQYVVHRLVDKGGIVVDAMYSPQFGLLKRDFIVNETKETVENTENLSKLPKGYEWEEISRMSGVSTLMPDFKDPNILHSSPDSVSYIVRKVDTNLPDDFFLTEIVTVAAKFIGYSRERTCGERLAVSNKLHK